ncbi:MAG: hypothetical protein ACJ74W_20800 [Pyrinomonadaceae bacterium]
MSEPEIARRCGNCGAAVRGRASFCPQCGQSMSAAQPLRHTPVSSGAEQSQARSSGLVDEAERVARALSDSLPSVAPTPSNDNKPVAVSVQTQGEASVPPATAQTSAPDQAELSLADAPKDGRGARFERVAGMRARAGERVERLRDASFVVLDEAQDDPALRFVLVAAVLFVAFLLILLFSHVLR